MDNLEITKWGETGTRTCSNSRRGNSPLWAPRLNTRAGTSEESHSQSPSWVEPKSPERQRSLFARQHVQSCLVADLGLESNPALSLIANTVWRTVIAYTPLEIQKHCYVCLELSLNSTRRHRVLVKFHFLSFLPACLVFSVCGLRYPSCYFPREGPPIARCLSECPRGKAVK